MSSIPPRVRALVFARDGYRCVICGCEGSSGNPLQRHHIVFRENGGKNSSTNLQTVCKRCHVEIHRQEKRC